MGFDSVTYAASKSYAKSLATGIASVSLDGMTLNITFKARKAHYFSGGMDSTFIL